jgi:hypothetical protein
MIKTAISFRAVVSRHYARLAAVRMTLGVQNMGSEEVFVDRPIRSGHWSFCARVRNREGTLFTTNFTLIWHYDFLNKEHKKLILVTD